MSAMVAEVLKLYRTAEASDQSQIVQAIMSEWARANPQSMLPSYWAAYGAQHGELPPRMTPQLEAELKRRIANRNDSFSIDDLLHVNEKG